MTSRHILFVNVAGYGHVYPTLAVVQQLVQRGHRVSYITSDEFAPAVTEAGAQVVRYDSPIAHMDVPDIVTQDDAETQMHMIYLEENLALLAAGEAHFGDNPPDLVAYDVFPFIAGRLLAAGWQRPAVRLFPIFAGNEHYSIFEAIWANAGYRHPAELAVFQRKMTEVLGRYKIEETTRQFWDTIEDFNIVFVPKQYQIAGDTFDDRFVFVGPSFSPERLAEDWKPPAGASRVALVSLGTTFNERPEFFKSCAEAFAGTSWHVVMSVGRQLDPATLGPLPSNVEVHQWISHLAVLRHASLCITHGATGTVMESLYWGCPIIVVPQSDEVAPTANQVAELGLGLRLSPEEVDAQKLRAMIDELADDDATRERVQQMQRDIQAAGGAPRAAAEIDAYLRSS